MQASEPVLIGNAEKYRVPILREAVVILNRDTDPKGTPAILQAVKFDPSKNCDFLKQTLVFFSNGSRTWKPYDRLASTRERLLERCEARGLKCPSTALIGG